LCVRLGTALCGRGLNNRQNDLHESAWIGIAYSKFSTEFFGAHSHSAQTDSDTGGEQAIIRFENWLSTSLSVIASQMRF
jgi:hypothetical protein